MKKPQSFEAIIGQAILSDSDSERLRALDAATLKHLVCTRCFSPDGEILDQGTAVAIEITFRNGSEHWIGPFGPSKLEQCQAALAKLETNAEIKEARILNGKELF